MIISLSILNIEEENRESFIKEFSAFKQDNWIHFDVMDGKFVENKTFNYKVVKEVNEYSNLFKDVHLMTYNPGKYIKKYKQAGTNQITFHYESVKKNKIIKVIDKIKKNGMKVGISIKPSTNISEIDEYLPYLDLILIMSVEPGKGGQKFIESSLEKIAYLKEKQNSYHYLISVDGGINDETSKLVKQAGANTIVVGTYLTKEKLSKEKLNKLA